MAHLTVATTLRNAINDLCSFDVVHGIQTFAVEMELQIRDCMTRPLAVPCFPAYLREGPLSPGPYRKLSPEKAADKRDQSKVRTRPR